MPTYGEILSKDSDGKKFMSALTNNGGANEFTAIKGANRATQNSEAVADLVVTLDGETVPVTDNGGSLTVDDGSGSLTTDQLSEYTDGATFTRSSSKLLAGLAGIYESTVSALTAGKVALARLTSRGAVVTAGDVVSITAFSSGGGTSNVGFNSSADGDIRSTSPVTYALNGFVQRAWIYCYNATDQAITVSMHHGGAATIGTLLVPAGAIRTIGAWTAATGASGHEVVGALAYPQTNLQIKATAAGIPTTGALSVSVIAVS